MFQGKIRLTSRSVRYSSWIATAVALGSVGMAVCHADERAAQSRSDPLAKSRHREGIGTTDQMGTFQVTGSRIQFRTADEKTTVRVLENLALERVLRTIDETRTERLWSISGTFTEFHGENYLLLNRAVLTSKPARGRNEALPTTPNSPSRPAGRQADRPLRSSANISSF